MAMEDVSPGLSMPSRFTSPGRPCSAAEHGLPGLVNLLGIESPGLTSSLAVGDYVASFA